MEFTNLQKKSASGMLYFFNAKTKKLISKISLANSDEEIKEAFEGALAKN